MSNETRYTRQEAILNTERLLNEECLIVGTGAVGRQVAHQLAAMGVGALHLIDFDTIEEVNLGPQGWCPESIGLPKAQVCRDECAKINPDAQIRCDVSRFTSAHVQWASTVFMCVDTIKSRELVFRHLCRLNGEGKSRVELALDGRMAAEAMRVLAVDLSSLDSVEWYKATLYPEHEVYQGACTARSTIYCSNIVAGLMVAQFAQHLRGFQLKANLSFGLLGWTMEAEDADLAQVIANEEGGMS